MPPPERWEAYSAMGSVIPGTKFIAFKVPLKEALLNTVAEEDRFSPAILVERLREQSLQLNGVIDLTFTSKYYDKEDFLTRSVGYKKVFTKGHEVPSDSVYKEFSEAVESFNTNDNLIGVHCTHGVNRTGYLIARYMIEKFDMDPHEAIDLFNRARRHNLERENYIHDLKRRRKGEPSIDLWATPRNKQSPKQRKPRWRHHKEMHPGWRQQYNPYLPMTHGPHPSSSSAANNPHRQWRGPGSYFSEQESSSRYPCHSREDVYQSNNFQHPGGRNAHINHNFGGMAHSSRDFYGDQQRLWDNPYFQPTHLNNFEYRNLETNLGHRGGGGYHFSNRGRGRPFSTNIRR